MPDNDMWQPIETAPKNTVVLVSPSHVLGQSCDMASYPSAHGQWIEASEFGQANLKPTHWMPLPKSPAALAEGEGNE